MQELLNLLNELAEKYKFDESDIKRIQEIVFSLEENGDSSVEPNMGVEDFQETEVEEEE